MNYKTLHCFIIRQVQGQLRNPESVKASRLMQGLVPRDPLMVGIIGCGRLGSHLANCILTYGEINPAELKISTRRPETLSRYSLTLIYNNLRDKSLDLYNDQLTCDTASIVHIAFKFNRCRQSADLRLMFTYCLC